eukprot:1469237-Amphidinium_carterae.1
MRGMFKRATSFNQDIARWNVCSASNMTDMFSQADSFTFLETLKASWPMTPSTCGSSTRGSLRGRQTYVEVADCSAILVSRLVDQQGTSVPWPRPPLALLAVGCLLFLIFALRCRPGMPAFARQGSTKHEAQGELAESSHAILPEALPLSLSTVREGQYHARVASSEVQVELAESLHSSLPEELPLSLSTVREG